MRIGVLTYHRSQNYGALWQAYALSTFLQNKGYDTHIIDYWPEYHKRIYKRKIIDWQVIRTLPFLSKIKHICYSARLYALQTIRFRRTDNFVKHYLRLTKSRHFDVCIYGSDQIWRKQHQIDCESFNSVYFGDKYIDAPIRISYAASMGRIEIESKEDKDFIRSSLANFSAVSVREMNLQQELSHYTDKPVSLTCDPVFLLSAPQWEKVLPKKNKLDKRYIFYYNLEEYKLADQLVRLLSEKHNLPVIEVKGYVTDIRNNRFKTQTASPIAFLSLLHDAEYVVTSAFHGVALSLCFNKQFYYAAQDELTDRALLLLRTFKLQDRRITDISAFNGNNIDYITVNPLIEEYRTFSRRWLTDNIPE